MKLLKQIEKRLAEIDELTRPTLEAEIWTLIPDSSQESAFFFVMLCENINDRLFSVNTLLILFVVDKIGQHFFV